MEKIKTEIHKHPTEGTWTDVKNTCRLTSNKDATDTPVTKDFKIKLLISEHSPITSLIFSWIWPKIPSWVSVHFARHWLGWQKWVSTRRSDRTGVDRRKLPQDEPVTMKIEANTQALINVSKRRLCFQASHETRKYMEAIKSNIAKTEPEIALTMVPSCIYRWGCPEFTSCGLFKEFQIWLKENCPKEHMFNIETRYILYQKFREEWRKKNEEC